MKPIVKLAFVAGLIAAATPAAAATNVIAGNVGVITVTGKSGTLRAGSSWGPGSTISNVNSPVDGSFEPESQQWNNGSFWWDEDPSVNASPVSYVIDLLSTVVVDQFRVQADNNDSYLLEYWDGAAWQSAFAIGAVGGFGLTTRDSGMLSPITTSRLRFTATGGDNYYSVSEIQAFTAVPELGVWAMMIIGFGAMGGLLRGSRRIRPSFV